MNSKVTYRQQYTRCGKQRCRKCREGVGHGPYWYAYWSEKGRTISKYVGTNLPTEVGAQFIAPTGTAGSTGTAVPISSPTSAGNLALTSDSAPSYNPGLIDNVVSAGSTLSTGGATAPPGHLATVAHIISIENIAPIDKIVAPVSRPLPSPQIRVYVLGQFRVERKNGDGWSAIDSRIWHRRRARALLGCLLSSPGRRASREQVMEVLWPDLDIDIAANRLNGAVHELRQILEPEIARPATSRMLRLERDILEIADNTQLWVDAEAFERLLKDANNCSDPHDVECLLEEASSLYRGGYLLEELYSEWAAPRRDALQRAWIGLLLDLANLRAERGALANAIETLDRLRTAEPTNETALQRLMILLTQLDRRGEALQVYRQHVALLQRDDESDPLPETHQLYEELRLGKLPSALSSKIGTTPTREKELRSSNTAPTQPSEEIPSPVSEPSFSRPALHLGRHNQSPLIGRQRELETMRQVMLCIEDSTLNTQHILTENQLAASSSENMLSHSARTPFTSSRPPRPHFLLLMGEPGIGKTRLAEELSLEAYTRNWAVAWSRSYEQEGTIPYRPWAEFLRTLLQSTSTHGQVNETLHEHELVNEAKHGLVNRDGLVNRAPTIDTYSSAQTLPFKLERLSLLLPEFALYGRDQQSYNRGPGTNPLPHEQERLHLWEAALGLIDTLSTINPLLLVFDDLHWADDSSIELLTYLVHHLKDQRVLLLATCRDAELPTQHKIRALMSDLQREQAIVALSVQPLSQSQIGTLVSHLPEQVRQSIQSQAAGNPFFAEELARYVEMISHEEESVGIVKATSFSRSRVYDARESDTGNRLLPKAIAAVLERRLSRLSGDCQALLGKAAVLGGSFELGQLLPMANEFTEDVVLDLLDEALHAGLLTEEGMGTHITYHFWHPLIISHLYERLSAGRRAHFHRKAAEAIKNANSYDTSGLTEKVVAAIVYHLSRGGGSSTDIAYYAELAGNQAYAIAAYSEAQRYYLQTIHAIIGGQYRVSLQASEGNDIHHLIQRITPQIICQLPFVTIQHVCRLLERTAECNVVQGNFEDVRYLYECILALRTNKKFQQQMTSAASDNAVQLQQEVQRQALLWREIGNTWIATGEYARAYECLGRGKEVMRCAGITTGIAWACLHSQYGGMLRIEGHYHEAHRYLQEALTMLERIIRPGIDYGQVDDLIPSIEGHRVQAVGRGHSQSRKQGPGDKQGLLNHAPTNSDEEQIQSQKDLYTRIERTLQGDPFEIGFAHEQLGVVLASSGPLSEGLKHMHIALAIYEQCELLPDMARVCSNLGAAHISKGEHASARDYLRRSLDLAERIGDLPITATVTSNLGDVAQRSGNLLEAEEWFKRSLETAKRINDRECISWSTIELANVQRDLGKLIEAKASILQAIIIGRAIKSPRCIRYALVALGELRIAESLLAYPYSPIDARGHSMHEAPYKRLLLRAMLTLQRALSLDELEIEAFTNGKHLLATAYYLLDDVKLARRAALQTLKMAQENEIGRTIGRAYRLLGQILMGQGQHEQADLYFEQALPLFREGGLRLDYARTLHNYGAILLQRVNDKDITVHSTQEEREAMLRRGVDYLQEARQIFTDCHASVDRTLIERVFDLLNDKNMWGIF